MAGSTKHSQTRTPTDADLRGNPGIGQTPGTARPEDVEEIEAGSTVEGDVENEPNAAGGVDPRHVGRTNK